MRLRARCLSIRLLQPCSGKGYMMRARMACADSQGLRPANGAQRRVDLRRDARLLTPSACLHWQGID